MGLGLATSLDGLAVGVSMAMLKAPILVPAAVYGLVTAVMAAVGVAVGGRVGPWFGRVADIFGGLVLIAIGVKVLVS